MCTVLLPPGDNPIAVNKYIIYITENTGRIFLSYRVKFSSCACVSVCVCVRNIVLRITVAGEYQREDGGSMRQERALFQFALQ